MNKAHHRIAILLALIAWETTRQGPALGAIPDDPSSCPRCGWEAPPIREPVAVGEIDALERAVSRARPGQTILLRDGVYPLRRMLDLATPGVVLRGAGGDPSRAVLKGDGMEERRVGVGLSVSAPDVTLADLTIGGVGLHGVQVRGEKLADGVTLHRVRVVDTGQQLLKGSIGKDLRGPNRGVVACSTFEYTSHAPGDYTNGVDVLGGRGWIVRNSIFRQIRGPEGRPQAGPPILFWRGAADTVVEGNLILDCYRGIALGLTDQPPEQWPASSRYDDHRGGLIRRNVLCNRHEWADEAIEANACPGAVIEHNTVLVEGNIPWSISVRFPGSTAVVRNNLTNRRVMGRDGARPVEEGNVTDALPDWFRGPDRGDLRPARPDPPRVGAFAPEESR